MAVFRGGAGRVTINGQSYRVSGWEMATREKPMNEAEWLMCDDPRKMYEVARGKISHRKWVLYALACAKEVRHLMRDERSRRAIDVTDRWVEGKASREELIEAGNAADTAADTAAAAAYAAAAAVAADAAADARKKQAALFREIAGNPFRTLSLRGRRRCDMCNGSGHRRVVRTTLGCCRCDGRGYFETATCDWLTPRVLNIARAAYDERDWERLPILADALEDEGADNVELLTHLRSGGPHVRGCWALDCILGRE